MSTRLARRTVAKTANYSIVPYPGMDSPGTLFTNGGAAGTVVFTLPTPNKSLLGFWYEFLGLVDQVITVAAPVADTLIAFNDIAADSVSSGGSGQRIGALIKAICVQSSSGVYQWAVENGTQGVTFIVTT